LDQVEIIACLAIAGPVRKNAVFMSNLHNIVIDGNAIAKQLHCPKEPYLSTIKVCKIIKRSLCVIECGMPVEVATEALAEKLLYLNEIHVDNVELHLL